MTYIFFSLRFTHVLRVYVAVVVALTVSIKLDMQMTRDQVKM
jgi:hypothetical protein